MNDLTQRLREARVKAPMQASYTGLDGKPHDVAVMQPDPLCAEAAARIDALEAEVARLRAIDAQRLDVIVDALTAWDDHNQTGDTMQGWWVADARAALTPPHVQHTAGVDATAPTSAD